ncbi:hypothetical protein IMG5_120390 [Ichthyophthirius multifiliis]|uniref:Eukaryotic peptide chain release factor subunit 1 n=1 Tax=Ichthyophthirius multifiliis TaxID=5932 RepID=G0QV00_ICHMU|nr:hypothetical protein IMG5_120390 [Ichthyophthirius multifiliis]EGR30954.1 hypothetical protein IMG5_120390 [Ichthyophthirius multifiliis]|eukprot:XP_004032541.1 hypothetical protein IMG5_120390 [Ichthyophthirius multifiliis]
MEEKDQRTRNIEHFKIKKLMKKLQFTRGQGTSMVSLILPPKKQISDATKLLNEEYGKATNIKDRINRQSVQDAMTSALQRIFFFFNFLLKKNIQVLNYTLKHQIMGLFYIVEKYQMMKGKKQSFQLILNHINPQIHLFIFVIVNFMQKNLVDYQKLNLHLVLLLWMVQAHYMLVYKEILKQQIIFIYFYLKNKKQILNSFSVELPKKHGRGGQSSVRFGRLRVEKRHNYLRKVCEVAVQTFICNDKINVQGLVLAGSGDFKTELSQTQMFDPRLQCKIVKIVDVGYGGENGLNQAIELSQESLANVKFVQEKNVISKFFDNVAIDSGQIVYGINDTMALLLDGVIETILCYEELNTLRITRKNKITEQISYIYIPPTEINNVKHFKDGEHELEKVEVENLTEWLAENYNNYGAELQFVTDKSAEGCQFVKGFSGLGGFLRYKVEVEHVVNNNNDEYNYDEDEDFI